MQRVNMLLLALAVLGQAEARLSTHKAALASDPINPPLKDVASDKKFFGPPFPADYPEDKRPVVDHSVLNKLRSPNQAYPKLQSKADYDSDFVKDENSDKGAWQAQFEYDNLRRKLSQEQSDEERAEARANKEGKDVDGAQKDADGAQKGVDDAQNGVDGASKDEESVKKAEDFDGPPTDKKLKELKKAVADAEERLAKQEKAFAECEKQLEDAKKELESLKASHKAMEEKLAADTKLWAEKKANSQKQAAQVKLNLQKSKDDKTKTASAKVQAAQVKLAAAEKIKVDMEKALAKEKAEHASAKKVLSDKKADMDKVNAQLKDASLKLQKLHGYKPAATPAKSGASMVSAFLSVSMVIAMQMF